MATNIEVNELKINKMSEDMLKQMADAGTIEPNQIYVTPDEDSTDYIVDSYVSGTTWYRIWASGFKECGGRRWVSDTNSNSVVLPIAFSNTDFTVVATGYVNNGYPQVNVTVANSQTINIRASVANNNVLYVVFGY